MQPPHAPPVELVPASRLVVRTAPGPFPIEATYTWEAEGSGQTGMTVRNRNETLRVRDGCRPAPLRRHAPG